MPWLHLVLSLETLITGQFIERLNSKLVRFTNGEASRVLAAFRCAQFLIPVTNYEGATQAGSFRHGEKQFVSWLHLVLSLVTLITGLN